MTFEKAVLLLRSRGDVPHCFCCLHPAERVSFAGIMKILQSLVAALLLLAATVRRTEAGEVDCKENEISLTFLDHIKETVYKLEDMYMECHESNIQPRSDGTCFCDKQEKAKAYLNVIDKLINDMKRDYYVDRGSKPEKEFEDTPSAEKDLEVEIVRRPASATTRPVRASARPVSAPSRPTSAPSRPASAPARPASAPTRPVERNPEDVERNPAERESVAKTVLRPLPADCLEAKRRGQRKSGVYTIKLSHPAAKNKPPIDVFCDMGTDGGGWTLIQRRDNYTKQEDFFRGWADYKKGFGSVARDFWLGNQNIYFLTNGEEEQMVRFDLGDVEGERRHAIYEKFKIGAERSGYNLQISGYSGDAGDSLAEHNGYGFSTKDNDIDGWVERSCAAENFGAWWYRYCFSSNLNAIYRPGIPNVRHVVWKTWKDLEGLKLVEIKIRARDVK